MMRDIRGEVALITGASRGIGRAAAVALAQAGCHVALVARNQQDLEDTAAFCQSFSAQTGAKTLTIAADITDRDAVQRAVQQCIDTFGGLHILINNAGIHHSAPSGQATLDAWEHTIDVNLRAAMAITRFSLPHIQQQTHGAIIFVASIAGKMGRPNSASYCASKHGIVGFASALFEDLREENIKVCAICPGFVNTHLVASHQLDHERMIQPEDVADTILFVAQFPHTGCPTEILLRPQRTPYRNTNDDAISQQIALSDQAVKETFPEAVQSSDIHDDPFVDADSSHELPANVSFSDEDFGAAMESIDSLDAVSHTLHTNATDTANEVALEVTTEVATGTANEGTAEIPGDIDNEAPIHAPDKDVAEVAPAANEAATGSSDTQASSETNDATSDTSEETTQASADFEIDVDMGWEGDSTQHSSVQDTNESNTDSTSHEASTGHDANPPLHANATLAIDVEMDFDTDDAQETDNPDTSPEQGDAAPAAVEQTKEAAAPLEPGESGSEADEADEASSIAISDAFDGVVEVPLANQPASTANEELESAADTGVDATIQPPDASIDEAPTKARPDAHTEAAAAEEALVVADANEELVPQEATAEVVATTTLKEVEYTDEEIEHPDKDASPSASIETIVEVAPPSTVAEEAGEEAGEEESTSPNQQINASPSGEVQAAPRADVTSAEAAQQLHDTTFVKGAAPLDESEGGMSTVSVSVEVPLDGGLRNDGLDPFAEIEPENPVEETTAAVDNGDENENDNEIAITVILDESTHDEPTHRPADEASEGQISAVTVDLVQTDPEEAAEAQPDKGAIESSTVEDVPFETSASSASIASIASIAAETGAGAGRVDEEASVIISMELYQEETAPPKEASPLAPTDANTDEAAPTKEPEALQSSQEHKEDNIGRADPVTSPSDIQSKSALPVPPSSTSVVPAPRTHTQPYNIREELRKTDEPSSPPPATESTQERIANETPAPAKPSSPPRFQQEMPTTSGTSGQNKAPVTPAIAASSFPPLESLNLDAILGSLPLNPLSPNDLQLPSPGQALPSLPPLSPNAMPVVAPVATPHPTSPYMTSEDTTDGTGETNLTSQEDEIDSTLHIARPPEDQRALIRELPPLQEDADPVFEEMVQSLEMDEFKVMEVLGTAKRMFWAPLRDTPQQVAYENIVAFLHTLDLSPIRMAILDIAVTIADDVCAVYDRQLDEMETNNTLSAEEKVLYLISPAQKERILGDIRSPFREFIERLEQLDTAQETVLQMLHDHVSTQLGRLPPLLEADLKQRLDDVEDAEGIETVWRIMLDAMKAGLAYYQQDAHEEVDALLSATEGFLSQFEATYTALLNRIIELWSDRLMPPLNAITNS